MQVNSGEVARFAQFWSQRSDAVPPRHVRLYFPVEAEKNSSGSAGVSSVDQDHTAVVTPVVASVVFAKATGALPRIRATGQD